MTFAQSTVNIYPGDNVQARIDSMPTGTIFRFKPGVHRLSNPLKPKDNQRFVGESGAILSGARQLTAFSASGSRWVASGQTQQGPRTGQCRSGFARCNYPEDLYVNGTMLKHVASVNEVNANTWHFDYSGDRIYIGVNPSGRTIETTLARSAFTGSARSVTIENLIIEKFASPSQGGAIAGDWGLNWVVKGNEVRFNHGVGVRIGHGMKVIGNKVHRNGQLGIGGVGDNVLVEQNEIAYNNTAGYVSGWEAGGTKFAQTHNLVVRGNWSHHNSGPGLWTDYDNMNVLYENNVVEDNATMGIFHEISYAAIIRNNVVRRNATGSSSSPWLWGGGIVIAASSNVQVYGNTVAENGDGITAIQQKRGSGRYGAWVVQNLYVYNNTITMKQGVTGLAEDTGDKSVFTSRNNRFTNNRYRLSGSRPWLFQWMGRELTESQWRAYGHDVGSIYEWF